MTGQETTDETGDLSHGSDMPSRILDAAARCFYRDGIWATGVDALAAEAGVSKRTLYNHFGGKTGGTPHTRVSAAGGGLRARVRPARGAGAFPRQRFHQRRG